MNSWEYTPAVVQALTAVAMVGLTWALARATRKYAKASERMTEVMAREFELRVAPLLEFEFKNKWSGSGWVTANVPMTVRNIGTYPAEVARAWLEFRVVGSFLSEPMDLAVRLEHGRSFDFDLVVPLSRIPAKDQSGATPRKNVEFRVGYVVKGVTGAEVTSWSKSFLM
jgi:hypothetical protein